VFVNALEDVAADNEHRVRDAYDPNYECLAVLKKRYDPANFFAGNRNTKPAA
jgi:hypothetical protein